MPAEAESQVRISEGADEANRQLLLELGRLTRDNPEAVDMPLDIYAKNPDAVADVVQFLEEHPERFSLLRIVVHAMQSEADYDLDIPEVLIEQLKKDPEFQSLQEEKSSAYTDEARKSAASRIRGFWLRRGVERINAA